MSLARIFSIVRLGHDLTSQAALLLDIVRIKFGRGKPFSAQLSLDGKRSVAFHFLGTRDELTILRDLFLGEEYKAPESMVVKTIVDAGANIGLTSAWFRLTYPEAHIYAYEPAPRAFKTLEKNAANIGNIEIFREAVGARMGSVTFHESDRSVASSIIESESLGTSHEVTVPMVTIDSIIERAGHVDLFKIDIEGAEFDALPAATKLNRATYITGEAHPVAAKRSLEEIRTALSKTHTVTIQGSDKSRLAGFYAIVK
jgi:FkbM family methyltransferase